MKTLLHSLITAIALLAMGGGLLAQQPSVRTGTLLEPVPIPIVINGRQVGNGTLVTGIVVSVLREEGERVLISNGAGSTWISKAQIALAAAPIAAAAPSGAPAASSASVTGRKPKLVMAGLGPFYDRAFVRDELRKAGYQVDEKYAHTVMDFNKPAETVNPMKEADIDAYDVFWFDSLNASASLPPELFQKLLKTRNKLVIISRVHDPIPEIRKYGTVQGFPAPNPYSAAKAHNNLVRGVNMNINADANVVESEEGRLDGCDIITSYINSSAKDTTNPAIGQPIYAALAQRTLLPEILKYMKRLEARLH